MQGIDVSKWQGDVDFARVAADGIELVYIRAGVGADYVDPRFRANAAGARQNGMKTGFYHFVTADTAEEARRQARFFVSILSGQVSDGRLVMDLGAPASIGRARFNEVAQAFLEETEQVSGRETAVYTDLSRARDLFDEETARGRVLWVAEYGVEEPSGSGVWPDWAGFQYTQRGRVSGIDTYVDRDVFREEILSGRTEPLPESERETEYTVARGDTLWKIAGRFGTTPEAVAERNGITDPNRIYEGQRLQIPLGERAVCTYVVKKGDTLSGIAKSLGTTVSVLAGLNMIRNPDRIRTGQMLEYML
ncbi:MAG: LysM peptidoglycan-binding domain-containing protein [Lachnospiraceae bacterium]|jgi:lysozyme|nr:LysM peptidoglycan-binding domain-containing protein [Lachnospiraceae bacterium]